MASITPFESLQNAILRKTSAFFKFISAQIFAAFLLSTVSYSSVEVEPRILHTTFLVSAALTTCLALGLCDKYKSYSIFIAVICAITAVFCYFVNDIRSAWGFWATLAIHVFFGMTLGMCLFKTDQYLRESLPKRFSQLRTIFYTFFVFAVQMAIIWLTLTNDYRVYVYRYSFYAGIACAIIFAINFALKFFCRSNNRVMVKESWYSCLDCHNRWQRRKNTAEPFEWCAQCRAEIFERLGIRLSHSMEQLNGFGGGHLSENGK